MKPSLGVLFLIVLVAAALGRPHFSASPAPVTENDFRKLEQAWLNAASTADLPALRKILSDDFMGSSFAPRILSKSDVVPPDGVAANHFPKSTLRDSTVRIFGDTAILMGDVEMQVEQKSELIRMTTVFQKHGEDWQVIAIHVSKAQD